MIAKPTILALLNNFGLIREPFIFSINKKKSRPPSSAGNGNKFMIARFTDMSAAKESAQAASGEMSGAALDKSMERTGDSSLAQISAAFSNGKNSVAASDQSAGDTVSISSAVLEHGAWVAVHEDDAGKPGRILGAQMFPAGTHPGTVDLLRKTAAGGTYYAMLHADDGDHAFDSAKDMPIKDTDGNPAMAKFAASSGASTQ